MDTGDESDSRLVHSMAPRLRITNNAIRAGTRDTGLNPPALTRAGRVAKLQVYHRIQGDTDERAKSARKRSRHVQQDYLAPDALPFHVLHAGVREPGERGFRPDADAAGNGAVRN